MRLIILIFSFLFLFQACGGRQNTQELMEEFIQQKVEERLTKAERTIMGRCYDNILEKAGIIADSILFEKARLRKDTSDRPSKPLRPDEPEIKTLIDSIPVAPLFDSLETSTPQENLD